ncbi:MAG: hypothetical protein GY694_14465, partial [Gammaproteobacteria bacterium]|nr:hypothetical protein [Gammaproteobacteria bacterium]
GEVRLISNYLSCNPNSAIDNREVEYLNVPRIGSYEGALPGKGFTLYSTLEPCAMCTGMMILTQLWRAVYVQRDPGYGDTLQRLSIDTSAQPNGYKPFPRIFDMTQLSSKFAKQLDRAYEKSSRQSKIGITSWLRSNDAKEIFRNAYADLKQYKSKFGNDEALIEAIKYLQNDVDDAYQANMLEECPTL